VKLRADAIHQEDEQPQTTEDAQVPQGSLSSLAEIIAESFLDESRQLSQVPAGVQRPQAAKCSFTGNLCYHRLLRVSVWLPVRTAGL